MKISDFQTKDVINIVDGRKLGQISDIELDLRVGRIESIVVPSSGRFLGFFGGGDDIVIPWRSIVKIGADVVLVKLDDPKVYRVEERSGGGSRNFRERQRERIRDDPEDDDDYR